MAVEISNSDLVKQLRSLKRENRLLKADNMIFSQITENVHDVYILLDHDRVVYVSPGFENVYGRSTEQLYDNPSLLEECIFSEDRKDFIRNRNKELKSKHRYEGYQYRLQHLNGKINNVWIRHIPIDHDKGKTIRYLSVTSDTAGMKQHKNTLIERTLQEQEKNFRALLQSSSDAISIINSKGIVVFEGSKKNKISDFNSNELLNKPIFDTVHPDDVAGFRMTFEEVLHNPGRQIKKEYRSLHKNKRWVYVESIFSNQLKNPTIKGIIVNSRDISDRKMAELKERVYHDNLIFLSNSALELLTISSRDQIYSYIPQKLTTFLEEAVVVFALYYPNEHKIKIESYAGLHPWEEQVEQILGCKLNELIFPVQKDKLFENAGQVITYTDEVLQENLGKQDYAIIKTIKDLLHVHKVYNIYLVRDNRILGNITILTLNKSIIRFKHIIETFVHQVTVAIHRNQLENELIQARDRAEESDKLKTAFLANMSHEIRTPMNGILGFAEMLNDDRLSVANRKKYLEIINSNGKLLINLIDDIIDFAKIESGQVNIIQDDFSLNKLLKQVRSTFLAGKVKQNIPQVKIKITKSFPDEKSYIRTDPVRLRQILTNLVGNSIKFTHEGYIEFGYNLKKDHFLEFYVKDTGIGISSEKLELIFERFIQADSSPSRKYGGSGLGLAISKGLVGLLGGNMWAKSEVDKGSTFFFTIPFVPVSKKVEEKAEKEESRTKYSWKGKLFLIAEDDKFSYKFLEGFLKQTKAEVIRAADGREAVELCRKYNNIDLVLMDIQMPEMNGLIATMEIKKFNHSIPIIAQTANAISEERKRCIEAGCNDFITKPVNISELYAKIDRCLSLKKIESTQ